MEWRTPKDVCDGKKVKTVRWDDFVSEIVGKLCWHADRGRLEELVESFSPDYDSENPENNDAIDLAADLWANPGLTSSGLASSPRKRLAEVLGAEWLLDL